MTVPSGPSNPTSTAIGSCGRGVVAGHHRDADAGASARRDGVGRVRTGRILESEEAQELQVVLGDLGRRPPEGSVGHRSHRDRENPQAATGSSPRAPRARSPTEWQRSRIASGAPFTSRWSPIVDRHAAAARVERVAVDDRVRRFVALDVDAQPTGEDVDRSLHRIPHRDPAPVALHGPTRRTTHGDPARCPRTQRRTAAVDRRADSSGRSPCSRWPPHRSASTPRPPPSGCA